MSIKHEAINVGVSRRILWFGSEAYPLHNITRTNTISLEPNRSYVIRKFVFSVIGWLFGAGIVSAVAPGAVSVLVFLAVLALLAYQAVKLARLLSLTLYELVVETAAGSHRGLISDDSKVVSDLMFRITDAINNPAAEFRMRVDNFHLGDNFAVSGNNNMGKVVR